MDKNDGFRCSRCYDKFMYSKGGFYSQDVKQEQQKSIVDEEPQPHTKKKKESKLDQKLDQEYEPEDDENNADSSDDDEPAQRGGPVRLPVR